MVADVVAGLGAIKTAFDIAKGLKDIDDAARRNAAVIDLQEKILAAQRAQAALVERIGDLEAKVASFEAWGAQKKRYELKDFGGDTFAYELKQSEAGGEPAHRICPSCYEKQQRHVLQARGRNAFSQDIYRCPGCAHSFEFGHRQPPTTPTSKPTWGSSRRG